MRALVALVGLVALAACDTFRFDLDEPIVLVPGTTLEDRDIAILATAAECWRQEFGVPFEIATGDVSNAQTVRVDFFEFACVDLRNDGFRGGAFFPGTGANIDLCPPEITAARLNNVSGGIFPEDAYTRANTLFEVVVHELGHASGILEEGTSGTSVMSARFFHADSPVRGYKIFGDEDRALLEKIAGPRTSSCDGEMRLYTEGSDSVVARCSPPCVPDSLEPSSTSVPRALEIGSFDLTLCLYDYDSYMASAPQHVTITTSSCNVLVASMEQAPQVELDVVAGEIVTVYMQGMTNCPLPEQAAYHMEVR